MKLFNTLCITLLFMGTVGICSASNGCSKEKQSELDKLIQEEKALEKKLEFTELFFDYLSKNYSPDQVNFIRGVIFGDPYEWNRGWGEFDIEYRYERGFKKEWGRVDETLFNTAAINQQEKPKSPKINPYSSLASWIKTLKLAQKKYPKPSTTMLEKLAQDEQNQSEQNKE